MPFKFGIFVKPIVLFFPVFRSIQLSRNHINCNETGIVNGVFILSPIIPKPNKQVICHGYLQINPTIFCTIGATKNATGNATQKPIANALIHKKKKLGCNPMFTNVITPDIKNAINNAIKSGNKILGLLSFIFYKLINNYPIM